ncbi:hypothetical protein O9993_07865 [Vibrio lentus]|nr:hypothetical protein [Vibrio lentus]
MVLVVRLLYSLILRAMCCFTVEYITQPMTRVSSYNFMDALL